jgi:hypothetical protein
MKILQSICANDGKLLTSETIDEMFTPQLNVDKKHFANSSPYSVTVMFPRVMNREQH